MENNKKDPSSIVDDMLSDIMKKMNLNEDLSSKEEPSLPELGPDETAIRKAGLIHPDDVELEQIIQETRADIPEEPEMEQIPEPEDEHATRYFQVPEEEIPAQPETAPQAPAFDVLDDLITPPHEEEVEEVAEEAVAEEVEEETEPEEEPQHEAQEDMPKKENPKKKKNDDERLGGLTHIICTIIAIFLVVVIGKALGQTMWLCATDLLALGKDPMTVSITIDDNDEISDVAEKLKDAGLIEYPKLFKLFTNLTGKGENILRGTINFNPEENEKKIVYDYNALVNAMSYRGSKNVEVKVMIPEGYNCAQIFALLEEKGVCSARALEEYAANGDVGTYWFLDGVQRGNKYCLEGYLFPDTYNFYRNDEPERVIKKLLNGFDARFTDRMIDKMVAFNTRWGTNYTIREFVILASIVEKETSSDVEGYTIASVFYNRLRHPDSYPFLQSDATIKYDTDYRSKGQLISNSQINASPYNTYTSKGLPPGPISNPGLASLDAALDPEDTSYYFFIWDKEANMHHFSKTLAEHSAWARKLGIS